MQLVPLHNSLKHVCFECASVQPGLEHTQQDLHQDARALHDVRCESVVDQNTWGQRMTICSVWCIKQIIAGGITSLIHEMSQAGNMGMEDEQEDHIMQGRQGWLGGSCCRLGHR